MVVTIGRALSDMGRQHLLLLILTLFSLAISTCSARDCFCNQLVCDSDISNCSAGVTTDPCGCCHVCARGLGETCGGEGEVAGVCGAGLTCEIQAIPGDVISGLEKGICKGRSKCLLQGPFKMCFLSGRFRPFSPCFLRSYSK